MEYRARHPEEHPEEHPDEQEKDWEHYESVRRPEVARRLELLNELAILNGQDPSLTHPGLGQNGQILEARARFEEAIEEAIADLNRKPDAPGFRVASFDIDLTLAIPEDDDNTYGVIDPAELSRLQAEGWIVGTCSDRDPSDQQAVMYQAGVKPDFCIPKELLSWARRLLPGAELNHTGDDAQRDRAIAEASGWQHQWPWEWQQARDAQH